MCALCVCVCACVRERERERERDYFAPHYLELTTAVKVSCGRGGDVAVLSATPPQVAVSDRRPPSITSILTLTPESLLTEIT